MEKYCILSSFYYYLCVNKKWAKFAKSSFSKFLHSDGSQLWVRAWSCKAVMGRHELQKEHTPFPSACDPVVTCFYPLRYIAV